MAPTPEGLADRGHPSRGRVSEQEPVVAGRQGRVVAAMASTLPSTRSVCARYRSAARLLPAQRRQVRASPNPVTAGQLRECWTVQNNAICVVDRGQRAVAVAVDLVWHRVPGGCPVAHVWSYRAGAAETVARWLSSSWWRRAVSLRAWSTAASCRVVLRPFAAASGSSAGMLVGLA